MLTLTNLLEDIQQKPFLYFGFPFEWIWNNYFSCVRFQANKTLFTSKMHLIQDFNTRYDNGVYILEKSDMFACVYLNNFEYSDGTRLLTSICSACATNGDLMT